MLKAGGCLASPSCPSDTFVPIGPCGLHAPPISNGFSLEKKGEGTFKTINTKDRKVKEIQPRVFPLLNPPPTPNPSLPTAVVLPGICFPPADVFIDAAACFPRALEGSFYWFKPVGPGPPQGFSLLEGRFFFPAAFAGLEFVCSFSHTRLHTNKVKLQRSCQTRRRPSDLVPVPLG